MANKQLKSQLLSYLPDDKAEYSLHEISKLLPSKIADRTLRRWLSEYVNSGKLLKIGKKRATKYRVITRIEQKSNLKFLRNIAIEKRLAALTKLRDLWTHTSTAIEGNTLTLGDTHFILQEGLTINGKPLKEHQEVIGHSRAIDILYHSINQPVNEQLFFKLHKVVQSDIILDIDKPYGAWKVRPNGTYTVTADEQQVYLEYALPADVPSLMNELINYINSMELNKFNVNQKREPHLIAIKHYTMLHAGIAHIHPFWDGNGRIARLIANLPLLRAGFPPLVIPKEQRKNYIQILANYEQKVGRLSASSGVWPKPELLKDFEQFCFNCYETTLNIFSEFES